jgi:hypothetical protein
MPFYPQSATSKGMCPNSLLLCCFFFRLTFESIKEVGSASPSFNFKYPSMCVHTSHQPYGYSFFTLHSWQRTHKSSCCSLWYFCCHCVRCWLPHGMKTTTRASFNHVQLLLLMGRHCAHQRRHSNPNWRCHCQPITNEFTSLILCNWRIHCLWCGSNQREQLLQPTPLWSILPISNWSIWMSTQKN